MTIVDRLRRQALAHPDRIAFASAAGATLTFAQWHERATLAGRRLAGAVGRGERVVLAFSLSDWCDYAIAYMAVAITGGVCVPVAAEIAKATLDRVLGQVQARLVISPVAVDGGAVRSLTLADLSAGEGGPLPPSPRDMEPAEILFTSGTTGPPEPVVATHANIAHPLGARANGAHPCGAIAHASAFASNAAQTMLLQPLRPGGRTVVSAVALDAATLADVIARFDVREITASPATLIMLADARGFDFSAIERVNAVAAPITPASLRRVAERFPRAAVVNVYTSTEAWPARTTLHFGRGPAGSVGRPRGGSDVAILGEDGAPLGPGEIGEIALTLPCGAPARVPLDGAWRTFGTLSSRERPGAGRQLAKTGDLGFLDEGGHLHLVDRESDVVNVGGAKVYSLDVEAALAELPEVGEVAVVGLAHGTLGEYAVAAVTLRRGADGADLRHKLRATLGRDRPASELVVLSELPHSDGGKVDKRRLRALLASRAARRNQRPPTAPPRQTDAELLVRVLCAWKEALGIDDIEPDESFIALGGNSLLAIRILGELSDDLAVELPTHAFFDWTTAAELASVLHAVLDAERAA